MDSYEMKRHGELFVVSMELKVKRNNYRNRIIDAICNMTGDVLNQGANYEVR